MRSMRSMQSVTWGSSAYLLCTAAALTLFRPAMGSTGWGAARFLRAACSSAGNGGRRLQREGGGLAAALALAGGEAASGGLSSCRRQ